MHIELNEREQKLFNHLMAIPPDLDCAESDLYTEKLLFVSYPMHCWGYVCCVYWPSGLSCFIMALQKRRLHTLF